MTLKEYEKLVRKYHADEAAKHAHIHTPPDRQREETENEERKLRAVLASPRAQKMVAKMPSVADVQIAVRRFVQDRIRSRTLKVSCSEPELGGCFVPLDENFRIERNWRNDHPCELYVQFQVDVTIRRGDDKEEERIFVEHGKEGAWEIRCGALSARKFHREFTKRKQHVVVLAVKDRAVADRCVRLVRAQILAAAVWDSKGWQGQRGLGTLGRIHAHGKKELAPVLTWRQRDRRRRRRAWIGGEVTQPLAELLRPTRGP